MSSRSIKYCSDENCSGSQGGYTFTLYAQRKMNNLFRQSFSIAVWVVGFSEYECPPEAKIELSALTGADALNEFKEYIKSRYGDTYGTLIKCD